MRQCATNGDTQFIPSHVRSASDDATDTDCHHPDRDDGDSKPFAVRTAAADTFPHPRRDRRD
jgi:hypothetical protein